MKHRSSALADVERETKTIKKTDSEKSRSNHRHKHSHRENLHRNRSPDELCSLRESIQRLEATVDLSEPPPQALTECLTDSPAQLLSSAWSAVGLTEVLKLAPPRLLSACRREHSRYLGRARATTPTDVYIPTECSAAGQDVRILWRRCIAELEKMDTEEVVAVLEEELDSFTVTWRPDYSENAFVHVALQTDRPQEVVEITGKEIGLPKSSVEGEFLELKLRDRAIRALLAKKKKNN